MIVSLMNTVCKKPEGMGSCKTSPIRQAGVGYFLRTPAGHNHFFDMLETAKKEMAEGSEDWYYKICKASESNIVKQEELDAARASMTEEQYEQEFECSFTAAIIGAYYAKLLSDADDNGRIT